MLVVTVSVMGQIPAGYYNGAAGLSGPQLKTALSHIIRGHTKFSYDYLWTAFYTTDDKPNGSVWDFYSDVQDGSLNGNPPYTFYFGSSQCATTPGYEGACYNREHSFPKSWMGAVEGDTMYTDLFHLCPTDSYVNTRRNNYPYGAVSVPSWVSQNGSKLGPCSAAGYTGIVFEPRAEFKGDLARNYFYMATRYESRIATWQTLDPFGDAVLDGTTFPCFEPWFKTMLLAWNAADPVSQKEIDRNNIVYNTLQHNRNPFIDHPEYVEMIWGNGIGLSPEPTNFLELDTYPNPNLGQFVLRIEMGSSAYFNIDIYNEHSQLLWRKIKVYVDKLLVEPIDLAGVPSGTYYVKVYNSDASQTVKVMVRR